MSAFDDLRRSIDVLAALRAQVRIWAALGDPQEPCRLLATGSDDGFSFAPAADLAPTLGAGALAVTTEDAALVAQSLALRAGFTGAFFAPRGLRRAQRPAHHGERHGDLPRLRRDRRRGVRPLVMW